MTTEEIYSLPTDGDGWRKLPTGNRVKLGDDVTLGDGVKRVYEGEYAAMRKLRRVAGVVADAAQQVA